MATMLLFLVSSSVFFSFLFLFGLTLLFRNKIQLQARIEDLYKKKKERERSFDATLLQLIGRSIQSWVSKKLSQGKKDSLRDRLDQAGRPFQLTPVKFVLCQMGLGLLFFTLLIALVPLSEKPMVMVLMAICAGGYGFYYPAFYLKAKIKQRLVKVEKALPDYFDMVTVTIEAGMGLDAALYKVSEQNEGPLSEEMLKALRDMQLGKSRREAFLELKQRTCVEPFQSLISSILQADQLGVGMSKVLTAQTERLREQRMQAAREKAMKAPVKMLIPMVFLIFPALFIVLLGPAVIQLVKLL
jgi:tight adherence protein C